MNDNISPHKKWRRQKHHHVNDVHDAHEHLCTPTTEKLRVFTRHLQQKCAGIDVDHHAIQHLHHGVHTRLDETAHCGFKQPITEEELLEAIRSGKRNKSPVTMEYALMFTK
jgi:uncharacterized protein involved in copper resistance